MLSSALHLPTLHDLIFVRVAAGLQAPDGKYYWTPTRKNAYSPAITLLLKSVGEEDNERGGEEEQERVTEPKGLDTREQISLDIVPALKVPENQGWPTATRQGLEVEKWLGRKTRRSLTSKEFYFVGKKPKKLGRNLSHDASGESSLVKTHNVSKEIAQVCRFSLRRLHGSVGSAAVFSL